MLSSLVYIIERLALTPTSTLTAFGGAELRRRRLVARDPAFGGRSLWAKVDQSTNTLIYTKQLIIKQLLTTKQQTVNK